MEYFIRLRAVAASQMEWVQGNTAIVVRCLFLEMSKTKPEGFRMGMFAFPAVEDSSGSDHCRLG